MLIAEINYTKVPFILPFLLLASRFFNRESKRKPAVT